MSGDWYQLEYNTYNSNTSFWSGLPPYIQAISVGFFVICGLVLLTLLVLQIVGMVKTFKKAKQPGWAAIVPFYNQFTLVKITGLELWWFALLIIVPRLVYYGDSYAGLDSDAVFYSAVGNLTMVGISLALEFFLNLKIAKSFGKTTSFAVGLTLLPPIFWMLLGFSQDIKYKGPDGPYKIKYPTAEASKKIKS